MSVALSIIIENNKILIGKIRAEKIDEYGGLLYAFPSVEITNQEKVDEEIINEVKNQTGLVIKVVKKIGERVHPQTNNYTSYFYCVKKINAQTEKVYTSDLCEFMWVSVDDIDRYMPTLFEKVKGFLQILNSN